MKFYFSKSCPYSLSMLEILFKYQTHTNVERIELIDVNERTFKRPTEIVGVPCIEIDNKLYFGDYAFDHLAFLHQEVKPAREVLSAAPPQDNVNSKNADEVLADTQINQTSQSELFDSEVIMPRK